MPLPLNEIRRSRGRFIAITAALSLITFLALVLAGLSDGLWFGATGAIRNTHADLDVLSADSLRILTRSDIPAADVAKVAAVPGVSGVGAIGTLLAPTTGPAGEADTAVVGFVPGRPGSPPSLTAGRLPVPGEHGVAVADTTQRGRLRIGSTVTVEGGGLPLRIIGFVGDARLQLEPTLWTTLADWQTLRDRVQPERRGQYAQALPVRVAVGANSAQVGRSIDAALGGTTTTVNRAQAVLAIPGAAAMRSTFTQIIVATFVVAALVVALFFALLTLEKRMLFATLKALGGTGARLGGGLLIQALLTSAAGLIIGGLLAWALDAALPPAAFPVMYRIPTIVVPAVATLLTGAAGAALSLRRVTRIDPAQALGGAQ